MSRNLKSIASIHLLFVIRVLSLFFPSLTRSLTLSSFFLSLCHTLSFSHSAAHSNGAGRLILVGPVDLLRNWVELSSARKQSTTNSVHVNL